MKKKYFFCVILVLAQIFLAKSQPEITFKIHVSAGAKQAPEKVFIAGDFNGWNPAAKEWAATATGNRTYQLTTSLKPGIYNFKITRGSWQASQCSSFGKAIANHHFKMENDTTVNDTVEGWQDNFAPDEKKHTATKQVQILSDNFDMPQLGRQRRIWLYLPAGYASGNQHYPVIYMHDGQNLFDEYTAGYGEWGVDELMDKMPEKSQCIIVAVDHGGDNRISEYCPYDSEHGKGQGDAYVEFLVKTLKPYIDQHYRTKADAPHTAIAGSSMGGLISMYAALKYPQVFGQAGIFSPAFWIAPEIYNYAQKQNLTGSSRFYFICGDAESDNMVADMQKMANIIHAQGVMEANAPAVIIKGAQHNEQQWNGDFPAFYIWLTEGFGR